MTSSVVGPIVSDNDDLLGIPVNLLGATGATMKLSQTMLQRRRLHDRGVHGEVHALGKGPRFVGRMLGRSTKGVPWPCPIERTGGTCPHSVMKVDGRVLDIFRRAPRASSGKTMSS